MGKGKPKVKEAAGTGTPGCQTQPVTGSSVPMTNLSCHNMTMEAFASDLRRLATGYFTNAVVDNTGLKGSWDFDVKYTSKSILSIAAALTGSDGISIFDAVDKQLGLKLDEQKIPTSVLVVDQVNQKPTDNPPDLATKLPALPPAEFEVAEIKPPAPGGLAALISAGNLPRIGLLPGGRVNLPSYSIKSVIAMAWNLNSTEEIVDAPKWLDSAEFDIIAKTPAGFAPTNGTTGSIQDLGPMFQALLIDRFKLKAHLEDRPATSYKLTAAKPKLKKADPAGRTACKSANGQSPLILFSDGGPKAPSRQITCQNVTMAQFADQLQIIAGSYIRYPVLNATGLEGAWDFNFTFSPISPTQLAGLRGASPAAGPGAGPTAVDPVGGTTIFDAVDKQLGLKLESEKRPYPMLVIDHIDEKPTDN
jgi:uncharacterized protein (TIGR03435 family)